MSAIKDARSGTDNSNLQEIIDAAVSAKHALTHGQNQYQTPEWLARACAALLPRDSYGRARWVTDVIDPQGAEGNLVKQVISSRRIVFELDNRLKAKDEELFRITGNCVRIGELMDELYPRTTFPCIVANPPFGIRWKTKDGSIDSTEWTWEFIKKRLAPQGFGFIISNAETLKRIGADVAESTYLFQEFPAGGIWDNCNVKLGIVHFHGAGAFPGKLSMHHVWDHVPSEEEIKALYPKLVIRQNCVPYGYPDMANMETLRNIINDERADRPPFNVYLGKDGTLKTYLSTYSGMKMKRDDIAALHRLQNCHPLSLTVEKELRILLQHTIDSGVYILEPAAKQAIKDALNAVKSMGCPIRPVTDFELIAYGDDHDDVECDNPTPLRPGMKFTKGKRYNVKTATYTFQDAFVKKVLTFGEDESECWMEDHDMTLHGQDRFTEVFDDNNRRWRFMDRPPASQDWCLNESLFWAIFKKPDVPTVAETMPDFYERNRNILGLHATMSGFQYFPGQHDYIARLGCKDYALVGADVGCHAKGTLILMADGRSKPVEDIVPGDRIMGWDNTPRFVEQLSRGRDSMARIVPVKGDPFVVNINHILTLVQTNVHHSRPLSKTNGVVRDVTVRDFLKWPKEWRDNHKLFRRGIELRERKVFFSPYFMGVYLGDGSSSSGPGLVSISKPDVEILDAVKQECARHGWGFSTRGDGIKCPSHHIKGGEIRSWLKALDLLGVGSGDRFIPDCYMRNSAKVRADVLAGLLDTDGHLDRSGIFDYISQSKQLAADVVWLARSLGLAAYTKPCEKRDQNGNGGTYYRVSISGDIDMIPTRIPRKKASARAQKKDVLRTGFKVEHLPEDDFYGFSIEGDGRFLLGDFTVTHNTGKTLIALSLIQLKSPTRTLIIAPQGTMRSSGEEDDVDYQPSQWITEIRRFAPGEPVFQLFSREDYAGILNANGGEFPPGIYVTYPQAYWQNGSFDHIPESWQKKHPEKLFRKMFGLPWDDENPPPSEEWFNRGVGSEKNGIRCVVKPSLAITIAAEQPEWDMVCVDEAHLMCNLGSQVTQNLLRLQPKFRYALTATPIPNFVNNLFSLMGWLCVPDWYKGDKLNVAWPYKIDDEGKFKTTFMCTEVDKTVQDRAKQKNDRGWSKKGVKKSPTISSPARLLKILKPNLAYISKEECNPKQVTCDVIDVRVPLGADQQVIYEHWLNRENLRKEFPNPLTRALAQLQRLRGVCASPASTRYRTINRGTVLEPKMFTCHSDFNAKTVTVLQLIRDRLVEGEQVVIVSARCGQSTELQRRLREAGIPTARIDSTVSAEMHTAEANRFKRGDARVMFMGIKCAQGHSFDQCRNLIIGSLEWSYGSLHQAKGRVWRLTSKQQVRVWCVLHENTIEELLFDRVATKQDAATICLHGKRVPRAYHQADASEVLGEHIVNYKASDGKIMSEAECESQWPELRRQLVLAFNPKAIAA